MFFLCLAFYFTNLTKNWVVFSENIVPPPSPSSVYALDMVSHTLLCLTSHMWSVTLKFERLQKYILKLNIGFSRICLKVTFTPKLGIFRYAGAATAEQIFDHILFFNHAANTLMKCWVNVLTAANRRWFSLYLRTRRVFNYVCLSVVTVHG